MRPTVLSSDRYPGLGREKFPPCRELTAQTERTWGEVQAELSSCS